MELEIIVIIVVLLAVVLIHTYFKYISRKQLEQIIKDHYKSENLVVDDIYKLTIADKIKYGVPLPLLSFYTSFPSLFTSFGKSHFSKIATIDEKENEQLRFVELYISRRILVEFKEFDKYSF